MAQCVTPLGTPELPGGAHQAEGASVLYELRFFLLQDLQFPAAGLAGEKVQPKQSLGLELPLLGITCL